MGCVVLVGALRRWAKLTTMAQSTLSLVIAILVIARAINVCRGRSHLAAGGSISTGHSGGSPPGVGRTVASMVVAQAA
jgi:hypothetical protein